MGPALFLALLATSSSCGDGGITERGTEVVRRLPFLQQVGPRSAVVAWASLPMAPTDVVVTGRDGRVVARVTGSFAGTKSGRVERENEQREEEEEARREGEPLEADEPDEWYPMAARVEGLEPGHRYCYYLAGAAGRLTMPTTLETAPRLGDPRPVRFVAFGDSGNGSAAQEAVAEQMAKVPFDFLLHVGDVAYRSGTHDQLQARFFAIYAPMLATAPIYPVLGNHDVRTDDGEPYLEAFVLPGNERWYSFDWGSVHFVALDTTAISDEQRAWLERDLAATHQPWIIVYAHHPPFTSARRGASETFRETFVPILERHHVALVLTGHEHHYERTLPIGGITYVVTGGGGGSLTANGESPFTARTVEAHHFLDVTVTPEALEVRAIDLEGRVIDQFEVPRPRR